MIPDSSPSSATMVLWKPGTGPFLTGPQLVICVVCDKAGLSDLRSFLPTVKFCSSQSK